MRSTTIEIVAQVFAAVGTVAVAILAIWGEKIRDWIAGPELQFTLHNPQGDLTKWQTSIRTIYYHIKVENKRRWALARRTRILCTGLAKKAADGSFVPEPLVVPVQLTWSFPNFRELVQNIRTEEVCDLGFLDEGSQQFKLALYVYPNNFRGFLSQNEAMRINVVASADNFTSRSPYVLEISWDGKWSSDLNEMRKHLTIKEVL